MRLREYEYILAIAREKNMIRAAQYLSVSQPALSRLLTTVEAELGTPLFLRRGREMTPTEAGKAYLANAQKMVEMNERFGQQMKQFSAGRRQLTISCPAIRVGFLVGSVLKIMRETLPDVFIEVKSASQSSLITGVSKGEYPMALGIIDDECERLLSYKLVGMEEMVLAVGADHPLIQEAEKGKKYPFIQANKLEREWFILSRNDSYSASFAQNFFEAKGISPPIAMRVPLTSMLLHAVADGTGIAIVPSVPLDGTPLEGRIRYLSICDDFEGQAVGVLFSKNRVLTEEEALLVDLLRRAYAENRG
ncbi:MAG: LysR family transcriptional regulator [Christensenellales bacterium]|nr:LysR family transcriptional regulator [Christensenellales bacterium]